MYNLSKMYTFLETHNLPKLNQEAAERLNRPIISKVEAVIKKLLAHKSPELDVFTGEFHHTLKKEITTIPFKRFQKIQKEGRLPNLMRPVSS